MPNTIKLIARSFCICLLLSLPVGQAEAHALRHNLGETALELSGPEEHRLVLKNSILGLKLAPARYDGVIEHLLYVYARESSNSLTRPYHNYGAVFHVGAADKNWTEQEFAQLKQQLLPNGPPPQGEELEARAAYLRELLNSGVGYKISSSKARKYCLRLWEASLLRDEPTAVALCLLQKKKDERDKMATLSLSLVRGKLIGTLYYQVDPGNIATARAKRQTLAWQDEIIAANTN